ncbi:hypothetical protein SLEP1_g40799 [Rubroshorea leprosula]|uniref:Uncharacterized protein n=1 Tax=Rubroshorea leprosula TaxID=152421 RepID=A0AAV5L4I5_9ROSI|nr:hypothetical protein SLEP1_g40799 [Rubroshorea leprosula]
MRIQKKRHLDCALLAVVSEIQTAVAAITTITTRRSNPLWISFRSPLFLDVIYGVIFIVFVYLPQCFLVGIGKPVLFCLASESGRTQLPRASKLNYDPKPYR